MACMTQAEVTEPLTMPICGVKRKVSLDRRASVKKVRGSQRSFQSGLS